MSDADELFARINPKVGYTTDDFNKEPAAGTYYEALVKAEKANPRKHIYTKDVILPVVDDYDKPTPDCKYDIGMDVGTSPATVVDMDVGAFGDDALKWHFSGGGDKTKFGKWHDAKPQFGKRLGRICIFGIEIWIVRVSND